MKGKSRNISSPVDLGIKGKQNLKDLQSEPQHIALWNIKGVCFGFSNLFDLAAAQIGLIITLAFRSSFFP